MLKTSKVIKTPIVVDCQIFQTFSWQRGMGKYSMELLRAALRRESNKDRALYLLFNNKTEINEEVREQLDKIAPKAKLVTLDLSLPKSPREQYSIQPIRKHNKTVTNKFIEEAFSKDELPTFLILSLYLDEVCSVFPDTTKVGQKVLLYYDSIPYLYHLRYGAFPGFFEHYYLPHTASIFEADKVLTISKTVANDLRLYFGIQKERIFNIDGASIPRPSQKAVKPKNWKYAKDTFVLMPTGQEIRKNNRRAVEAFKAFLSQSGSKYTLVITSHFSEEGRKELKEILESVDFSGNVSEGELLWLYKNCRFVLFPSEYEGLGLPVLEAVEQDKLVACSNISVFREMSDDAFTYFDPVNVLSITEALHEVDALKKGDHINSGAYEKVKQKYTWDNTSKAFTKALDTDLQLPVIKKKKKIAIFAPHPSGFSAIGKDIGELHAWYTTYFDVDYYFDKGLNHRYLRPNYLQNTTSCFWASDFTASDYERYDAVIYHIGNSEYHTNIIRAALAFPGYMILHDTDLSGLYMNLLQDDYITQHRYEAEQELDKLTSLPKTKDMSAFITSAVNNQYAVVVHSVYAKRAAESRLIRQGVETKYLELPFDTPIYIDIKTHINRKKPSIAFAGIIAKIKGIDLIEEIAMSDEFSDCQINIFGFSTTETEQLKKLKQIPNVKVLTNPTDFEFQQLLEASDILVNVRLAYRGETSGSTLSHMRYGGIAMVRDFGWFSELPDDAVVKVREPGETAEALKKLLMNNEKRALLHDNALRYMQKHHSHKAYAEGMYQLINKRQDN